MRLWKEFLAIPLDNLSERCPLGRSTKRYYRAAEPLYVWGVCPLGCLPPQLSGELSLCVCVCVCEAGLIHGREDSLGGGLPPLRGAFAPTVPYDAAAGTYHLYSSRAF